MDDRQGSAGGIGFFGLLQIVFIVLKLCGVIHWAWWVVLLPILIWIAIFVGICALICWLNR